MTVPPIPPAAAVRRATGVVWEAAEGELVLLDRSTRRCHVLSGTAARVWELIETPRPAATIRAAAVGRARRGEEPAGGEVDGCLRRLAELGLVEISDE